MREKNKSGSRAVEEDTRHADEAGTIIPGLLDFNHNVTTGATYGTTFLRHTMVPPARPTFYVPEVNMVRWPKNKHRRNHRWVHVGIRKSCSLGGIAAQESHRAKGGSSHRLSLEQRARTSDRVIWVPHSSRFLFESNAQATDLGGHSRVPQWSASGYGVTRGP